MPSEFELIARHFSTALAQTELGVGDDAALFTPRPGMQLAVSSDMLVAGTHFFADADPFLLGWKTAAVNISDIAAMAGEPRWITLALSLPAIDEAWVTALAAGFHACCKVFRVDWVGGDTTRGPLNLCATVFGEVPSGKAVRRDGAQPGDEIWVSGEPGLAALGLAQLNGSLVLPEAWQEACIMRLHKPTPRVELGLALRGIARAMIDVSDGLLGDLAHILERSRVGAVIEDACLEHFAAHEACPDSGRACDAVLAGGDDYELLFTAAPQDTARITALAEDAGVAVRRIGRIVAGTSLSLAKGADGTLRSLSPKGYDHFA